MAECSYSRCVQQRRNIRRELQRWTKNMVHIVGLERIAEELMGRRKWKLYQESMSRNYLQPLNNNIKPRINEEYQKQLQLEEVTTKGRTTPPREEQNGLDDSKRTTTTTTTTDSTAATKENKEEVDRVQKQQQQLAAEAEERLKDWSPESRCYFCVDGKLDSEHTTHGVLSPRNSDSDTSDSHSDSEAPPTLTPSSATTLNNHHHHHPQQQQHPHRAPGGSMTTIESVTAMAALSAVAALSGSTPAAAAPHLPFYAPGLLPPNWYLANVARNMQQVESMAEAEKAGGGGEQPLDLSCSKSASVEGKVPPPSIRLPTLDSKSIFNSDFRAKPRMSAVAGRRTYTEDELQAALRDIQSGKLGTRRAAVIYGIPRSTLRNKVYKLALERERESHLSTSSIKLDDEEMMDEDKELSGAEEEKEVEKALDGPLITMEDILRFSNIDNPEALKSLLLRSKEGQEAWTGLEHSSIGPYIQNLLFSPGNLLAAQKVAEGDINPLLPEVIKRMIVQDQLLKEQQQKTHLNNGDNERLARPSPSNSVIMKTEKSKSESDMETEESSSNVILKIPSFKPTTSKNGCDLFRGVETSSIVSPPVTSDSSSPPILPGKGMTLKDVKDVIAQSISQKFQQSLEPARRPIMEMEYKRGGFTPPLGGISVIKSQQEINRPFQQQQQQQQPQPQQPQQQKPQQSGATQGGKGTRPKRGKYRNYDRDSLVEAVRAVQRGEMSVHRAGSYYGVPHSTLEYKVKERHLMRPRKRDPKPNPVDEKIASLKQNDLRNAATADKMKPVMKPPQKYPPTSPNGMKIPIFDPSIPPMPGYNPAPFPFWTPPGFHPHIPIDCGRNAAMPFPPNHPEFFAASQMMQKLQEESSRPPQSNSTAPTLAKSARQMAESLLDGSNTNGSFLDGIIRSSLESGVPGCDEKASKEDKNVAPENMSNKALLDQLCRNSRLTPLSKPTETQNLPEKGSSPFNEDITRTGDSPQNTYDPSENSTIELSNDSNESNSRNNNRPAGTEEEQNSNRKATPPARIYLKQELTKPENLKPEMLVRFRDVLGDINGTGDSVTGSASESDAAQD